MNIQRTGIMIKPNPKRVLLRPFDVAGSARIGRIVNRVASLSASETSAALSSLENSFSGRHRNFRRFCRKRYEEIQLLQPALSPGNEESRLLIGACFSMEYSPEAAALFNPSMIWHPDQSEVPPGSKRFILSLRATGEGHISSISFRTGIVDTTFGIMVEGGTNRAATARDTAFEESRYHLLFEGNQPLNERVLFPAHAAESNGMEDARFVDFSTGDDNRVYYATYTAYDGNTIQPRLLETKDFLQFTSHTLRGAAAINKNLALFPRMINGKYAMLARQDNENNYLMFSENLLNWEKTQILEEPEFPWEFIQVGNCGSPIETEAGWLVISHAVGPMRRYVLSAFLLDIEDPSKIIGRLKKPLLSPDENEREGYVPNVVYSCGSQIYKRKLIIPYALSDSATSFAIADLDELLEELTT